MAENSEHAGHVVSPLLYVGIFLALMLGTGLTVFAAFQDLSFKLFGYTINGNPAVALFIACCKATLVILFFMHVKYSPRLMKVVVCAGIFWLLILLSLTMVDYSSRAYLTSPQESSATGTSK